MIGSGATIGVGILSLRRALAGCFGVIVVAARAFSGAEAIGIADAGSGVSRRAWGAMRR